MKKITKPAPAKRPKKAAAKPALPKAAPVTLTLPTLAKGEHYAGIVLDENGQPSYHLVGLAAEFKGRWADAVKWAEKQGGQLPDRREFRLQWVNARQHFKTEAYWSGEQVAGDSDYAWFQGFGYGDQYGTHKGNRLPARAVRRVII